MSSYSKRFRQKTQRCKIAVGGGSRKKRYPVIIRLISVSASGAERDKKGKKESRQKSRIDVREIPLLETVSLETVSFIVEKIHDFPTTDRSLCSN